MMWNAFDILKKLPDGGIVWLEAAKDLETARERIKFLATYKPGEYVIFCQETQNVIATPWVTYPRQELEATDSARRPAKKRATRATKKAREKSTPKQNTKQIIAEIVDDIGRSIAGKK
jgi:hypothetical protein